MKRFRTNRRPGNRPMSPKELEFVMEAKIGPCMACLVRSRQGLLAENRISYVNDYNHAKSGNIRISHGSGYALCRWHHMRQPGGCTHLFMATVYGPSLLDGSRLFHATYGTDEVLINLQREHLGWSPDA